MIELLFGGKLIKFKKLKKKNAFFSSEKPNLIEFSDFYENIFSHVDRPSNEFHKSNKSIVHDDYSRSLKDEQFDFSVREIQ